MERSRAALIAGRRRPRRGRHGGGRAGRVRRVRRRPIARRLVNAPLTIVPAALAGAVLLLLSDLIARRIFAPTELPVGVVTGIIGAPYLIWLLARANRIGRGMSMTDAPHARSRRDLTLAYDQVEVARDLSVAIPQGKITVHRRRQRVRQVDAAARPRPAAQATAGVVLLDGESIHRLPTKEVATRLGILPQSPIAPEGITVADLVARGRYPHQKWFRQWTAADEAVVTEAMRATGTMELADAVRSTSCRAGNASVCGSRWRSRRAPT